MIEKTIKIEGVDPRELFGAQDIYLDLIRDIFPALRIVARSSTLKVLGEEHQLELGHMAGHFFPAKGFFKTLLVRICHFTTILSQYQVYNSVEKHICSMYSSMNTGLEESSMSPVSC